MRLFMNFFVKSCSALRKNFLLLVSLVLLLVSTLCFFAARWYIVVYGDVGFDSILYTMSFYLGGVKPDLIEEFNAAVIRPALLLIFGIYLVLFLCSRKAAALGKSKLFRRLATVFAMVFTLGLTASAADKVGLGEYVMAKLQKTAIYENYYVDPYSVDITFPEKKKNLIFIFMESMETAYFSTQEGGASYTNLVPELYDLAKNNVNFSQNDSVGGFRSVGGTTWTIGAMVGQTSGVPLITPDSVSNWQNGYGNDGEFLPGLTTLQDVLHDHGYYQSLMVGSSASFGGRKTYYTTHGTDVIYELNTAREDGIVPQDYFVWWGMEDKYLYQYARQELLEISAQDTPFAFTMLTVDTHHVGGYVCEYCSQQHDQQYQNIISCASKQLAEFIDWIRQQDFAKDTAIIVCGDHPSMDADYFLRNVPNSYVRRIYNCFINPFAQAQNQKNREFCTLDIFPTTLAAMGCTIKGDRLGLGTNLFSSQPTLMEEMGSQSFLAQLSMSSDYYSRQFRLEQDS